MINPEDNQFVFIIGAARSGTKLLRDLLGRGGGVSIVPFDVNYVWRHGNEGHPDDALTAAMATGTVETYVRRSLSRLARPRPQGPESIIVEKSVSNTLRVPFVHALFPGARFVHLVRDGRDVAESAARMWCAPVEYRYLLRKLRYFPITNFRYAYWFLRNRMARGKKGPPIWGPRYPHIEIDAESLSLIQVVARQWLWSVESTLSGLGGVSPGQCHTVHFEDLVRDVDVLRGLCEFLEICEPAQVLEAYSKTVRQNGIGKWKLLGLEERQSILQIQEPMLRRLGYIA